MPPDSNHFKDILDIVLTIATVFLAVYTYKLVEESRKARRLLMQPCISVYLDSAETDPSLIFITVKNIGQGTAYDLAFDILKDIGDYGDQATGIGARGMFKEGMKFCPSGYSKRYFLMETKSNYKEKMAEEIKFVAKYKSVFGEVFDEMIHIRLTEQGMSSSITPADTYIGSVAESLKEIRRILEKGQA